MSEGTGKKKGKGAKSEEAGVLASLPSTRPNRLGRPRGGPAPDAPAAGAEPKRKPKASPAKPSSAGKPKAKAKPKPASAPRRRGTTNPAPEDRSERGGPRPVRAGAPALAPEPEASDRTEAPATPPTGTELVTTVVQAAGELAQIGLTVGGQILKRAADRLPRP